MPAPARAAEGDDGGHARAPAARAAQGEDGDDHTCASLAPRGLAAARARLSAGHNLEAHTLADSLQALCPSAAERPALEVVDALALLRLDEPARAHTRLISARAGGDPRERARAEVLLTWSYLIEGDEAAHAAALARLPPEAEWRLRLFGGLGDRKRFHAALAGASEGPGGAARVRGVDAPSDPALRELQRRYEAALRTRRPWLAGVLSAALPGAGQAYAGSWQAAGVSLVFNALLVGATIDLARRDLPVAAGAAGLAASFFYVGGVLNAADLATRRNERAAEEPRAALERLLVPETAP